MKWIKLSFQQRSVPQSKPYRNIVKAARCEAAIKMPHPRNDHPDDRYVDVGTCLIENEKVEPLLSCELHTGEYLLALIQRGKAYTEVRPELRLSIRKQVEMFL